MSRRAHNACSLQVAPGLDAETQMASELECLSLEIPARTIEAIVATVVARTLAHLDTKLDGEAWPEWMSVETAARYLDVSRERLRKLQARREIPFRQEAPGCRVLFRRRDLDDWTAEFRQPARSVGRRVGP